MAPETEVDATPSQRQRQHGVCTTCADVQRWPGDVYRCAEGAASAEGDGGHDQAWAGGRMNRGVCVCAKGGGC